MKKRKCKKIKESRERLLLVNDAAGFFISLCDEANVSFIETPRREAENERAHFFGAHFRFGESFVQCPPEHFLRIFHVGTSCLLKG